jgi:hypothetical protein
LRFGPDPIAWDLQISLRNQSTKQRNSCPVCSLISSETGSSQSLILALLMIFHNFLKAVISLLHLHRSYSLQTCYYFILAHPLLLAVTMYCMSGLILLQPFQVHHLGNTWFLSISSFYSLGFFSSAKPASCYFKRQDKFVQ